MRRPRILFAKLTVLTALINFPSAASALTFTNGSAISIPSSGSASPYPSSLVVSGVSGTINDVNVTLRALSHAFPADLDILLVGPGGQTTLLMSDVGGGTDVTALTITFDDAASNSLANPLTAGIFKPTNVLGGDTFPAPAPAGPYGAQLSVFNGASANGTWQLFVFDDSLFAAGSIANGWSLEINGHAGTASVPEEPAVLYVGLGMFVGAFVLRRCFRKP